MLIFLALIRLLRIISSFGRGPHSIVPRKRGAVRRIEMPMLPIFDEFFKMNKILRLFARLVQKLLEL